MANTINRITGNGNRSAAEGIPRSASGATREAAPIGASRTSQQSKQDASLNTANPQSEGGDEVQITNTAAKLATLGQSLSASSPVDDARVARISQALADGSYRISAQQIATGLLQSDHALGQIGS
jgi:negative regulator of flagellin synthesis FlgM